jgi:molecular chaperone GrpE
MATAQVLRALLPTIDNLERAAAATGDEASVREGLSLIMKELGSFLEKHNLVADDPIEQNFDPERHEALSHEEAPGHSEGQIVEVFQKGYSIGDRLIRPALVRVAKGNARQADSGSGSPDEEESA